MCYGHVYSNQPRNEHFCGNLESTKCNAVLGITGATRDLPVKTYSKNSVFIVLNKKVGLQNCDTLARSKGRDFWSIYQS